MRVRFATLIDKLKRRFFDFIAVREERKTYLGHGDFDVERGWRLLDKWWISYEKKERE